VVLVAAAITCLSSGLLAVDKDKAQYIGGTPMPGFPASGPPVQITAGNGNPRIIGRVDTPPETALTFDAGRWGSLTIPYKAISSLEYGFSATDGLTGPAPAMGLTFLLPWEITEQFTRNAHYLLVIVYQHQSGAERKVVFELGRDIVRPTVAALERYSGKAVEFLNVEACTQFKSAEDCGYGTSGELRGLRKVFLDVNSERENRDLILAELQKANLGLEMLPDAQGAEVIVAYHSVQSFDSRCPCEGGRGEVTVVRGAGRRVVLVFADRKMGIWGKRPSISFGRALAEAITSANAGK
jgi:hypothetical protein